MCGRFDQHTDPELIAERFGVSLLRIHARGAHPHFNVAPSQVVLAVRLDTEDKGRELVGLKWGLIPFWSKEPKTNYSTINARAETVDTKPTYRHAFRNRRCLIPADGFYEWRKTGDGKQPYYITAADGQGFGFAGLWERWAPKDSDVEAVESCSIIVTAANSVMQPIHDRMPVILAPGDYDRWLAPDTPGDTLKGLLRPCDPAKIEAWPVSTRVDSPQNDGVECLAPLA
jgi:putative SOS response-associated peptidase YedK